MALNEYIFVVFTEYIIDDKKHIMFHVINVHIKLISCNTARYVAERERERERGGGGSF